MTGEAGHEVPEGATAREAAALGRMRRMSFVMDRLIKIPYVDRRIGIDPLLGIAPLLGDAIAATMILYLWAEAYNLDAPPLLYLKMLGNYAIDFVFGSIPVIGVVLDWLWAASDRNVDLIQEMIADRAAERAAAGGTVPERA